MIVHGVLADDISFGLKSCGSPAIGWIDFPLPYLPLRSFNRSNHEGYLSLALFALLYSPRGIAQNLSCSFFLGSRLCCVRGDMCVLRRSWLSHEHRRTMVEAVI